MSVSDTCNIISAESESPAEFTEGQILDYILNCFKWDTFMNIDQKVYLTAFIYSHKDLLAHSEDFYEEECHLALVNWAYSFRDALRNDEPVDEKIYHLIYNILIIFEILPIKVTDLFELKIFEKLNKIRKFIKQENSLSKTIFEQLERLLNYWTLFCTDNSISMKKRKRCEENGEEERKWKKARTEDVQVDSDEVTTNTDSDSECQAEETSHEKTKGILKKYKTNKSTKPNKHIHIKWNDENLNQIETFNVDLSPVDSIQKKEQSTAE